MNTVTVAYIKDSVDLPSVQLQHIEEVEYSNVAGLTFYKDKENFSKPTQCVVLALEDRKEATYPIDKVAYITLDEKAETANIFTEDVIATCKGFCMDKVKDHLLDPMETEIFYYISGRFPILTVAETVEIVDYVRSWYTEYMNQEDK